MTRRACGNMTRETRSARQPRLIARIIAARENLRPVAVLKRRRPRKSHPPVAGNREPFIPLSPQRMKYKSLPHWLYQSNRMQKANDYTPDDLAGDDESDAIDIAFLDGEDASKLVNQIP